MRKIEHAFSNFRRVFDRHFKSLDEARYVEDCALAGDDRAQVRLWRLYQDGYFTERTAKKAQGSYSLVDHTTQEIHVVSPEAASYFRGLARQAYHPEATTFQEAIPLGRRNCMSQYAVYRDGKDGFYDYGFNRPTILENPHLQYKGDEWGEIVRQNKTESGFVFFADWDKRSFAEDGSILKSDHVDLDATTRFVTQSIGNAIPPLEVCARAGDVEAAKELFRLYNLRTWQVERAEKIFGTWKEIPNPFFDRDSAGRWKEVSDALEGRDNVTLLDTFIFSQQNSANGLYNVGIALLQNKSVRAVYNKRLDKLESDLDAARSLIKKSAWAGCANAAWFCGDSLQSEAEDKNDSNCLEDALLFYQEASTSGHPNAKHRLEYLSTRGTLPINSQIPRPQVPHMSSPTVFISYAREDLAQAHHLYDKLKEKGFRPWLDKKNLLPGQSWEREIEESIEKADFVLVCLSSQAVQKRGFFQAEIRLIIKTAQKIPPGNIYLIPVRLDECVVPHELSGLQYVDLFASDGFEQVSDAIATRGK
jgi:TPR repeat protein